LLQESIYDELKSTQEKVQLEMSQRKGLEDQILRFKQSVSDSCAEEVQFCCTLCYFDVYIFLYVFFLFDSLKHHVVWLDQDLD
jgi:hypothetical protein